MVQRPQLAVLIARVATGWSRVEERLGFIIVQLLRAEAHTGMKMYQALTSSASQFSVLRAVARDRLDTEMQQRLDDLLADYKKVARKRNKIVHGHWDTSPQHPNELVWTDAADEALSYSEFWAGYNGASDFAGQMNFARSFKGGQHNRLLYGEADFEAVLSEMTVIATRLSDFSIEVEKLHRPVRAKAEIGKV